jgi:hypothetical protein
MSADKNLPIQSIIYTIRGCSVMLDSDLARLYEVETKVLNQAVKRNSKRFPADFMFQLTQDECNILKSQIVTSSWGGTRKLPNVFTEQGIAMLSGLLKSDIAIDVNIRIMRVFVAMRQYASAPIEADGRVAELHKLVMLYIEKNDKRVNAVIEVLNRLIKAPAVTPAIGFKTD